MNSWVDRINNIDMEIITGDGKGYLPQYVTASVSKNVNYNISEFVFKDVDGSLVTRGTPRGTQYDIEIIFQGADNIDVASEFQDSAADPRAWEIIHPFYDSIKVQPVSLKFDNSGLNKTVISGIVIETLGLSSLITHDQGAFDFSPQVTALNTARVSSFAASLSVPDTSDIQQFANNINGAYASISSLLNGYQKDADSYLQKYNQANAVINLAVHDSLNIATQVQNLLVAPAYFVDSVINRFRMFNSALSILNTDVAVILAAYNIPTSSRKRIYELNAGTNISGLCLASTLGITNDYDYRPDVLNAITTIVNAWNAYLLNLQALQTLNGGQPDSYIPNPDSVTALSQLVNKTISTLFQISAGAKQQRKMNLAYDSNVILVAYDLYGISNDNSEINTLMTNNNIGLNELLLLKQGREIIYYV